MSILRRSLLLTLVAALVGCGDSIIGGDDDDSGGDDDDAVDGPLFDQVTGSVEYRMTYTDGTLEGDTCTEFYGLTSVDATAQATVEYERLLDACSDCVTLFQGFFNAVDTDCTGGPDLPETNFLAFDLLTQEGTAILWWKADDGEWGELGSGVIDFDEVEIEVEDPDSGGGWGGWGGGNSTTEEPCNGFGNRCRWDGLYINSYDLGSTDRPE
jgi:hypothetical protein